MTLSRVIRQLPYLGAFAWADRPAAASVNANAQIMITDLPSGARGLWHSDGTYWKPSSPIVLYDDKTAVAGTATTSEQIIKQASLPGSLIRGLRSFEIAFLVSKDGTTDAATTTKIRLGILGTVAGDSDSYSTGAFNAAGRMFSGGHEFFAFSNTVLRTRMTAQNAARLTANSVATVYPLISTLSDFSASNFYCSITATMAGTTNIPSGNHLIITGF